MLYKQSPITMDFTEEQIRDIRAAVKYYMQRHVSITSPRYDEYSQILNILSSVIEPLN